MSIRSTSPPAKRAKLEPISPPAIASDPAQDQSLNTDEHFQCSICLQDIVDRTVIPTCSHEFCFGCLMVWSEQSRRCPLCSQPIGEYLIHNIRSKYDFRRHHLTPLRTSPKPAQSRTAPVEAIRRRRTARERERERRLREDREANDKLTRSIEKRRWIYQHDLYAKHVASNSYTRYRPYPSPAQFAASSELISRTTTFLRRELQVWDDLDVEFLTTFTISMMKSIDIRSESAVKLLAEFLDMDAPYVEGGRHVNAEHFAHEVYSYVRSPFRDLFVYDTVIQYDVVPETPPQPEQQRDRRWLTASRSRSQSRSRSHSRSRSRSRYSGPVNRERSVSWSPSGRHYPSTRDRRAGQFASPDRHRPHSRDRRHQRDLLNRVPHEPNTNSSSVEDVLQGRRPTETIKGKERADVEVDMPIIGDVPESGRSETQTLVEVDPVAQRSRLNSHVPPPRPRVLERKKAPRHRSLLESVQAHLTPGTKTHPSGNAILTEKGREPLNRERHRNMPSLDHEISSTVPALLVRLSDSTATAQEMERGPGSGSFTASLNAANCQQESSSVNNQSASQSTRMSAPQIMARTRARLARNDSIVTLDPRSTSQLQTPPSSSLSTTPPGMQDPAFHDGPVSMLRADFDGLAAPGDREVASGPPPALTTGGLAPDKAPLQNHALPTSGSLDDLQHQEEPLNTHHMTMRGDPVDERPPKSTRINNDSHPHASSDARIRLLARLEQEKDHTRCVDTRGAALSEPDHDITFQCIAEDSQPMVAPGQVMDTSVEDSRLMEAKLRTRAQLQVRLAAEKRSTGA